jgi:hypothetical protein
MKFEVVGVYGNGRTPEIYENLHALAFGASGEIQQRVFVKFQLRKNAFEPWIRRIGHSMILTGVAAMCVEWRRRVRTARILKTSCQIEVLRSQHVTRTLRLRSDLASPP